MRMRRPISPTIWKFVSLVAMMTASLGGSAARANDPSTVKARPRIAGDLMEDFRVEDIEGNTKSLRSIAPGKYTMVTFVPVEALEQKNLGAYFQTIRTYIEQLGYEIIVITTLPTTEQRAALHQRRNVSLHVDPKRAAFMAMGLADSNAEGASVISGIFFVAPSGKILSQFTSSDRNLPFSGDALVLSARVYKQISERAENGLAPSLGLVRTGPTVAPVLQDGGATRSALAPASSSVDVARAETQTETQVGSGATADASVALPDESVLRLLTIEDIARTNSYWIQAGFGMTAYDARRNTWSPRWSPGLQIGRRANRFGAFVGVALDQTFDLTQEVKRLDVVHLGLGAEVLSFYGRIRGSISAGVAILNSDTDIDSRGKIGWYFDLKPVSIRWGSLSRNAFEFTPLSLNVSVPVTRGIPLIQVGYMTTLSYEWATGPRR